MTTIPEHRNAGKRKLERDDYGGGVRESVENDPKKPKLLPWRKVIDVRKWELLPAVVYELLALIKKSEKPNPDDGRDTQQKKTAEEIKVLPHSKNRNKIFDIESIDENSNTKSLNTKESNKLLTYKSSFEDSVQNLEKLNLPANKTEIVNVQLETTLTTKTTYINIENVVKEDLKKYETNEKEDITGTFTFSENISNNNVGNNISKIENLIALSKTEQVFNLLKNSCLNGLSKIPISKPCPCTCKYCLRVSNLSKDQLGINNIFTSTNDFNSTICFPNYKPIPDNIYDSEMSVSDCSVCIDNDFCCSHNLTLKQKTKIDETSKTAWVNDLVSLVKKNEMSTNCESSKNDPTPLKHIKNDESVTEQIKFHLPLCDICKKSKSPNSTSICKCNYTYHI